MPAPAPPVALEIAHQASRVRGGLLRAHRHQALWEDLEDIFGQAVLELLLRAQRDPQLQDPAHISNALRQRFAARLADCVRSHSAAARACASVSNQRLRRHSCSRCSRRRRSRSNQLSKSDDTGS